MLTDIRPSIPVIGTFRKGAPRTPKAPGKELPYFRFVNKAENVYPELTDWVVDVYGDEPTRLDVVLVPNPLYAAYVAYDGRTCVHRCNGQVAQKHIDPDSGQVFTDVLCEWPHESMPNLTVNCILKFMLPELAKQYGVFGVFEVRTTSLVDAQNWHGSVTMLQNLFGNNSMIPAVLYRYPMQIQVDGVGQVTKHFVGLQPAAPEIARMLAAPDTAVQQLPQHPVTASLPAPAQPPAPGEPGNRPGEDINEVIDVVLDYLDAFYNHRAPEFLGVMSNTLLKKPEPESYDDWLKVLNACTEKAKRLMAGEGAMRSHLRKLGIEDVDKNDLKGVKSLEDIRQVMQKYLS